MKIYQFKLFLPLLATAIFVTACNRPENDPFVGKDSYIAAFSLQQGGVSFTAAIAGDVITITAPEGLSLSGAKATVTLSENATIYPSPDEVTEWDEERRFAVTAYNGDESTYKYTVERSGIAHNGTVVLETQSDVDLFGQQGVTLIDGNLTIGRSSGTDSITDLRPLTGLKEVVYTLTLQSTCAITGLEGLEKLEHVGDFQIGVGYQRVPHLEILSLPALKTAGSFSMQNTVTIIAEFPELEQVKGLFNLHCPLYQLQMPRLQTVGTLTLAAASNANTSLAQISLPELKEVEGNISVDYLKSVTKLDLPELKKVGGFSFSGMTLLSFIYTPKLEEATERMSFYSMNNLTELNFPALKHVGTLSISSCKNMSTLDVSKLETVKNITIASTPVNGMADFTALKTVESVSLSGLTNCTTLELPAGVQQIKDFSVSTYDSPLLREINVKEKNIDRLSVSSTVSTVKLIGSEIFTGTLILDPTNIELEGFREVDSLSVSVSGNISNMHIKGIRKVRKGIYMYSSSVSCEFSMPDMEEIGGDALINFPSMRDATADTIKLDKLKKVGGNLALTFITKSAKVLSCPELTTVGGDFTLGDGYEFESYYTYRGFETLNFPKLTTIGGKLTIFPRIQGYMYSKNNQLQNLNGFASLTSVKAVDITLQTALTDYSGLANAFKATPTLDFSATDNGYNPTRQDLLDGKWTKPE
jgi:hypothetical protein